MLDQNASGSEFILIYLINGGLYAEGRFYTVYKAR